MAVQKTEGIILKKYHLRETSYILVIYTKDFGKIKGVIKGARNPCPQFAGNLEIFTRGEVLFYKKKRKTLDLISRFEAIKTFLPIRKNIERLTYANYFIELIDIASDDYDANEKLYNILSGSLDMLATASSAKRTGRIFELKFLEAIGLNPQLTECAECGSQIDGSIRFNVKSGGVVCSKCSRAGIKVSPGTINFMRRIQLSDLEKTSRIKVAKEVGKETEIILKNFLMYHINKPIKSLEFLDQLEKEKVL